MKDFPVFLTSLLCGFYLLGNAAILPPVFPKYQIANKEIHLKHGKLHPHEEPEMATDDDEHLVYRYRWLGDDIVKTESDFEGEIDEEYTDKEKKIKLPGGCELTEDQFLELESFKKETYYVKKWYSRADFFACCNPANGTIMVKLRILSSECKKRFWKDIIRNTYMNNNIVIISFSFFYTRWRLCTN